MDVRSLSKLTQIAIDRNINSHVGRVLFVPELICRNARNDMIGVVLWSDATLNKAVIWCEDQGDLAFFRRAPDLCQSQLSAGDWVEFDLVLQGNIRLAENPVVLAEPASPEIAEQLTAAATMADAAGQQPGAAEPVPGLPHALTGAVIPFPGPRSSSAAAPERLRLGRY
ncbi:hypothetical protein [Cribrihabitans neustonicus]|uniref:hypothetical protein n=1 Tax=Cribrihabitans neustonicus TaxID=1429085 RepID=UPI003B5B0409